MNKFNYMTFFDADVSIFNCNIRQSFLEYFLIETLPVESYARHSYDKFIKKNNRNILNGASERFLNREYYKNFSGMPAKLMSEIGCSWYYKSKLELNENFLNQKIMFEIEMHKRSHAQIVLLSNSFLPCLEPLMEELASDSIICTELETINGYYTGNIISDPLTADGKRKAIEKFLVKQNCIELQPHLNSKSILLEQTHDSFCDISYDYNDDITNYFFSERFKSLYRN